MNSFEEIENDSVCPCGSGKKYRDCCKKKNFKFGLEGDNLVKEVPMNEEVMSILKKMEEIFFEYYGRKPGDKDFVASFSPIYNDEVLLNTVYMFRKLGFPENKIYAYYKSDGLFPCDINIDLLPQTEIEEFQLLCKEYDNCLSASFNGGANILQYVLYSNSYIEGQVEYAIQAISACFNDFIHRHSKTNSIREYKMNTEIDYCIFSALKTVRTLQSINKLRENNLSECIYALSRGIFENYMYICNINVDSALFKEKLLPKVDEENYTFDVYEDGRINYNKVIDRKTGNKFPVKIIISDLKKNLPYDADKELYTIFYQNVCQYVHADVMSAKSYFAVYDPYEEINPSLIASLIAAILTTLLLSKISENKNIQPQYRNDALYLCKNLSKKFINCLELAKSDPEHSNVIFELLLNRLREQFLNS